MQECSSEHAIASQATYLRIAEAKSQTNWFLPVCLSLSVCPLPSAAMAASSQAEGAAVNDFRRAEAVNPFAEEGQDEN